MISLRREFLWTGGQKVGGFDKLVWGSMIQAEFGNLKREERCNEKRMA